MTGSEAAPRMAHALEPADDVALRRLARRAVGLSGADIERLVRVARQRARREQRPVAWRDLDELLSAARPTMSAEMRRRVAVHEGGHMLARVILDHGTLTVVTIDAPNGGFAQASFPEAELETEQRCQNHLVVIMAGRAAEQVVYGSALAGSGGLETSLGFGRQMPLLYRDPDDWQAMIRQDRQLAMSVHRRLERAEASAQALVRQHRSELELIAGELEIRGTLEGYELAQLVKTVRASREGSGRRRLVRQKTF
jgi:ATP-dependent Zn protease